MPSFGFSICLFCILVQLSCIPDIIFTRSIKLPYLLHSRPQSPRSFWSAPRIETSGRDRSRKSANHGLPAFVRSLRNLNNNGYYRLHKWAGIALARYLAPARGLDPWHRPKGSWALGTRMYLLESNKRPVRECACVRDRITVTGRLFFASKLNARGGCLFVGHLWEGKFVSS